jgi:hypothetical protein
MRVRGYAHNGRRDYNRWLAARAVVLPFDRVITSMLRVHSSREILAALDNRCTWRAVSNWRVGWRRPPQWVLDRLAEIIRADAEQLLVELGTVETQPASPGKHPAAVAALRRINARAAAKAAERRAERA